MKPYTMNYSIQVEKKGKSFNYCPLSQLNIFTDGTKVVSSVMYDSTRLTATVEPVDPDDVNLTGTIFTKAIEPTDPDEIRFCVTILTESVEPGDPDELV